jgi:hypothetical protein
LSSHLYLGLPSWLFLSGFPTKFPYAFLISHVCYMSHMSQTHCFNRFVSSTVMNVLAMLFLH